MMKRGYICALATLVIVTLAWTSPATAEKAEKTIIAHRGASGYLPEHTLEAYAFAYAQGADYIEPDLVMTKDAHLICCHDGSLESCTDVEKRFPDKKREDGHYYAADFTLAEIKQLRVHERRPNRFPAGPALFEMATLEEVIQLVQGLNKVTGRDVGIYPELKEPGRHAEHGLPMEEALIRVLARYGYEGPGAKVFIQCFYPDCLIKIRKELGSTLPQIMLIGDDKRSDPLTTKEAMSFIATFAEGIGPAKERLVANPDLVKWAHEAGLVVHPYTFAEEGLVEGCGDVVQEIDRFFFTHGVDGLFTDYPDKAVQAVRQHGVAE